MEKEFSPSLARRFGFGYAHAHAPRPGEEREIFEVAQHSELYEGKDPSWEELKAL